MGAYGSGFPYQEHPSGQILHELGPVTTLAVQSEVYRLARFGHAISAQERAYETLIWIESRVQSLAVSFRSRRQPWKQLLGTNDLEPNLSMGEQNCLMNLLHAKDGDMQGRDGPARNICLNRLFEASQPCFVFVLRPSVGYQQSKNLRRRPLRLREAKHAVSSLFDLSLHTAETGHG